jgi:hypothetical protein
MTTLNDCGIELSRIIARARLLELALIHAPDYASQELYADGVRQQAQDILDQLENLAKDFHAARGVPAKAEA